MHIKPLEQVRNLCKTALRSHKSIKTSFPRCHGWSFNHQRKNKFSSTGTLLQVVRATIPTELPIARDTCAMDFAFNLSLSAINVAKAFGKQNNLNLYIADCKLLFHNALLIERFLSTFGNAPDVHKNTWQKEHYFQDFMQFGLRATA